MLPYLYAYLVGALLMGAFVHWSIRHHDGVRALFSDVPRQDLAILVWPILFGLLWPLVLLIVAVEIAS